VTTALGFVASLPSPPDNAIHIGALQLRAYGLSIALGVLAAICIAQRRWSDRGGDPSDVTRLAVWSVAAGLVGARLYHVTTDYQRFEGRWLHTLAVWEGGLGIPGGLIAGVLIGALIAHRRGLPVAQLLDVVAPAIPVAQAIGRLGNWFNQELYGRPTTSPGACTSTPNTAPPATSTSPPTTQPLSTRRSGTSPSRGSSSSTNAGIPGLAPAGSSPSTSSATPSAASGSKPYA